MTATPRTTLAADIRVLEVPGARLHHEVRGDGPPLLLVGAPMGADAFAAVADVLAADHTVLTTDPRGIARSTVDDPDLDSTPEARADDLASLIAALDAGPAAVLGSSGGAVGVLALAQRHPGAVSTVIAHEPPLGQLLEDGDDHRAQIERMVATYEGGDRVDAWRQFVAAAGMDLPEPVFQALFGGEPDARAAADERFQFLHMMRPTAFWLPDVAALRAGPVRVVVGIGEASAGQFCDRTSRALAAALGTEPALFPGGHTGFQEDPAAFAARLRTVLAAG